MQTQPTPNHALNANAPEIVDEETEDLILQYRFGAQTYGLTQPAVVELDHVIRQRQAHRMTALRSGL